MVRKALLSLALLVLLSPPALAGTIDCYVCGDGGEGHTDCIESTLANFATKQCELRVYHVKGKKLHLCRTYGETCIQDPPPGGNLTTDSLTSDVEAILFPQDLVLAAPPGVIEQAEAKLGKILARVLLFTIEEDQLGTQTGRVSITSYDGSEEPLGFDFKGTVTLEPDGAILQTYRLEGHPDAAGISLLLSPDSASIEIERHDGSGTFHAFEDSP